MGNALFVLRFCGQGMFGHMVMTAMGRWFEARRGQAVFITNPGHPAGEIVVLLLIVLALSAFNWRAIWMIVTVVLVVVV